MDNPVISVIVPIYNVDEYLDRCIESIVNQSYTNLEIILVDDGSPDNCPSLCDDWAKKDSRIKVIHKENGGAGSARNTGIKNATGEWIGFVDGDDSIDEKFYNTLLQKALSYSADISACDFFFIDENGEKNLEEYCTEICTFDSNELLEEFYSSCKSHWVSFCNKIIKKEMFEGLSFPEHRYFEDWTLAPMLYFKSRKTVYSPEPLYNYFYREGSAIHTETIKRYSDCVEADIEHYLFFNKQNISIYNDQIRSFMFSDFKKCVKVYRLRDRAQLTAIYSRVNKYLSYKLAAYMNKFPIVFKLLYKTKKLVTRIKNEKN